MSEPTEDKLVEYASSFIDTVHDAGVVIMDKMQAEGHTIGDAVYVLSMGLSERLAAHISSMCAANVNGLTREEGIRIHLNMITSYLDSEDG